MIRRAYDCINTKAARLKTYNPAVPVGLLNAGILYDVSRIISVGKMHNAEVIALRVRQFDRDIYIAALRRLIFYFRVVLIHNTDIKQPDIVVTSLFDLQCVLRIGHILFIADAVYRGSIGILIVIGGDLPHTQIGIHRNAGIFAKCNSDLVIIAVTCQYVFLDCCPDDGKYREGICIESDLFHRSFCTLGGGFQHAGRLFLSLEMNCFHFRVIGPLHDFIVDDLNRDRSQGLDHFFAAEDGDVKEPHPGCFFCCLAGLCIFNICLLCQCALRHGFFRLLTVLFVYFVLLRDLCHGEDRIRRNARFFAERDGDSIVGTFEGQCSCKRFCCGFARFTHCGGCVCRIPGVIIFLRILIAGRRVDMLFFFAYEDLVITVIGMRVSFCLFQTA